MTNVKSSILCCVDSFKIFDCFFNLFDKLVVMMILVSDKGFRWALVAFYGLLWVHGAVSQRQRATMMSLAPKERCLAAAAKPETLEFHICSACNGTGTMNATSVSCPHFNNGVLSACFTWPNPVRRKLILLVIRGGQQALDDAPEPSFNRLRRMLWVKFCRFLCVFCPTCWSKKNNVCQSLNWVSTYLMDIF